MSQLLPDGVRSLRDAPARFHQAVKAALMFLNFEEMQEEDVPPRNIWLDSDALKGWFAEVKRRHKSKADDRGEIEEPRSNAAIDLMVH